jgi:hypothetical protein
MQINIIYELFSVRRLDSFEGLPTLREGKDLNIKAASISTKYLGDCRNLGTP